MYTNVYKSHKMRDVLDWKNVNILYRIVYSNKNQNEWGWYNINKFLDLHMISTVFWWIFYRSFYHSYIWDLSGLIGIICLISEGIWTQVPSLFKRTRGGSWLWMFFSLVSLSSIVVAVALHLVSAGRVEL